MLLNGALDDRVLNDRTLDLEHQQVDLLQGEHDSQAHHSQGSQTMQPGRRNAHTEGTCEGREIAISITHIYMCTATYTRDVLASTRGICRQARMGRVH